MGPWCEIWSLLRTGRLATRPNVGLMPNTPQKWAGMRIEPAPSEP